MYLSQVSRTAILLLICRAVEAEKNKSEFDDPMSVLCLERLMSIASEEDRPWIMRKKRRYEGIQKLAYGEGRFSTSLPIVSSQKIQTALSSISHADSIPDSGELKMKSVNILN
jgi:hypothetical protein